MVEGVLTDRCGHWPFKIRYAEEWRAKLSLRFCNMKAEAGFQNRKEQRYYLCDNCNGFHLTSKDPEDEDV